ncbi:MAG: hypothetical protein FJZ01_22835 [Candidatus Sericytochromatia bacterium]|nr:hypothetical protein [Candidatus Tanganyikabacteria bacterium]
MTARFAGTAALAFLVSGCAYTIKLDPGAEDASVYVNGDLVGQGVARFDGETEYGYPESFVARVVPQSGGGGAYSVEISREFDTIPALLNFGTSVITSAALLTVHYYSVKSQIDANPGNWPALMFGGWNLGLAGAVTLVSAPLNTLQYFKFREYYDLTAVRDRKQADK